MSTTYRKTPVEAATSNRGERNQLPKQFSQQSTKEEELVFHIVLRRSQDADGANISHCYCGHVIDRPRANRSFTPAFEGQRPPFKVCSDCEAMRDLQREMRA